MDSLTLEDILRDDELRLILVASPFASLAAWRLVSRRFSRLALRALNCRAWRTRANVADLQLAMWRADDLRLKQLKDRAWYAMLPLANVDSEAAAHRVRQAGARQQPGGQWILVIILPPDLVEDEEAYRQAACEHFAGRCATHGLTPHFPSSLTTAVMVRRAPAHRGQIWAVAAAGGVVASGGDDGIVHTWRLAPSSDEAVALGGPAQGTQGHHNATGMSGWLPGIRHPGKLSSLSLTPNGACLVTGCQNNPSARIWNASDVWADHSGFDAFQNAGYVHGLGVTGTRSVWLSEGPGLDKIAGGRVGRGGIDCPVFVTAGQEAGGAIVLSVVHVDCTSSLLSIPPDEEGDAPDEVCCLAAVDAAGGVGPLREVVIGTHRGWVYLVEVNIAAMSEPPRIIRKVRHSDQHPVFAAAVGHRRFVSAGDDRAAGITVWGRLDDSAVPLFTSVRTEAPGKVWALAISGHLLASGGDALDTTGRNLVVHLWDCGLCPWVGNLQLLRVLESPCQSARWGVRSVAIDDSETVVAGGDDGVLHVWRLERIGRRDWKGPMY